MATHYLEKRTLQKPVTTLAADIARHLQLRQHLGKAVIVCDNPFSMLSATRKQWLRLGRLLQRRRASTLNAEEILRYTRSIMHMQNMRFIIGNPELSHDSHVYFVTPKEFTSLPPQCFSIYVTSRLPVSVKNTPINSAPDSCLIVDYYENNWEQFSLQPKRILEEAALVEWHSLESLLKKNDITVADLNSDSLEHSRLLDEALDTLLGMSGHFLRCAFAFQHALTLAQPISIIDAEQQKHFDIALRLAHRVHALTPNILDHYIMSVSGDKESYFLRDRASEMDELNQNATLADTPYLVSDAVQ